MDKDVKSKVKHGLIVASYALSALSGMLFISGLTILFGGGKHDGLRANCTNS